MKATSTLLAIASILVVGAPHLAAQEATPPVLHPSLSLLVTGYNDGFAPIADVYALTLENPEPFDINAIELDLTPDKLGVSQFIVESGGFLNPRDLNCGAGGVFPCVRGVSPTDSFVVLPDGLSPLSVFEVFESDEIRTAFTVPNTFILPPFGTVTIAHISVPTGEPAGLLGPGTLGQVAFRTPTGPVLGVIAIVPEPSAIALVLLPLFGIANRRTA